MSPDDSSFAQQYARAPDGSEWFLQTGWENHQPVDHWGFPSCSVGIVVSFAGDVSVTFEASGASLVSAALVAGMHVSPVRIREEGPSHGIQIQLSPSAVRRCFGPGAGELTNSVTNLDALAGARGRELAEQLFELRSWENRFALVQQFVYENARYPSVRPELDLAWRRFVAPAPKSVALVAEEVGWSRRHLSSQFRREYGVSPSMAKRVARFERARRALRRGLALADAALQAGYYDQAHLTHEWSRLAWCTPTEWLNQQFPFVQDQRTAVPETLATPHQEATRTSLKVTENSR
ncbi:MAG: helix-turn-helix transcriptional regulator [Myxococcales bacterium]|nr:helix-turn-helix transcriptional regulator [Myxococcales bacterium]